MMIFEKFERFLGLFIANELRCGKMNIYFNHILITKTYFYFSSKCSIKKEKRKNVHGNFQKLGRSFKSLVIYSILGKCNAGDTSRKPYGTRFLPIYRLLHLLDFIRRRFASIRVIRILVGG